MIQYKKKISEIEWYIYINMLFAISSTIFPIIIVQTYENKIKYSLSIVITLIAYINIIISIVLINLFLNL